ncbi:MAG: aminoglycoside phosphotransferase family protein [Chloroflexi bacterium]|nr:aminoglycoside phosphotransferase family protein [Chloroflexota bacterium]
MNSTEQLNLINQLVNSYLGQQVQTVRRFPTGLSHYVYDVVVEGNGRYVIRLARPERNEQLKRGIVWQHKLAALGIPLPQIYHDGEIEGHAFAITERLPGEDLEMIYATLTSDEKRNIAHAVASIQQRIHTMPPNIFDKMQPWSQRLSIVVARSERGIAATGIGDGRYIDLMRQQIEQHRAYFEAVTPAVFLYDLNVRNVIIHNGSVSGIIDVDDVWVGDPLLAIGRGKTILLTMQQDLTFIDAWCHYLQLTNQQLQMVDFYALLYCIRFMGTTGQALNGNHSPQTDPAIVPLLNQLADQLLARLTKHNL